MWEVPLTGEETAEKIFLSKQNSKMSSVSSVLGQLNIQPRDLHHMINPLDATNLLAVTLKAFEENKFHLYLFFKAGNL